MGIRVQIIIGGKIYKPSFLFGTAAACNPYHDIDRQQGAMLHSQEHAPRVFISNSVIDVSTSLYSIFLEVLQATVALLRLQHVLPSLPYHHITYHLYKTPCPTSITRTY